MHTCRTWRKACGLGHLRNEIVVRQEESGHSAIEYDHLDHRIVFDRRNDRVQLGYCFRSENIEGRVIQRDPPIRRRASLKPDLWLRHGISVYAGDHVGTLHLFELAHGGITSNGPLRVSDSLRRRYIGMAIYGCDQTRSAVVGLLDDRIDTTFV